MPKIIRTGYLLLQLRYKLLLKYKLPVLCICAIIKYNLILEYEVWETVV